MINNQTTPAIGQQTFNYQPQMLQNLSRQLPIPIRHQNFAPQQHIRPQVPLFNAPQQPSISDLHKPFLELIRPTPVLARPSILLPPLNPFMDQESTASSAACSGQRSPTFGGEEKALMETEPKKLFACTVCGKTYKSR